MAKYFKVVSALAPDVVNYPGPYDPWAPPPHKHPPGRISGRVTAFGLPPHAVVVEGSAGIEPLPGQTQPPFGGPLVGIGITYRDLYPGDALYTMRACVGVCGKHLFGGPLWTAVTFGVSNVAWYWTTVIVTGKSATFRLYANALGVPLTINTSTGPVVLNDCEVAGLWGDVLVGKGNVGYLSSGQGITGVAGMAGDLLGDNQFDATIGIASAGVYHPAGPVLSGQMPVAGTSTDNRYIPIEFYLTHPSVFPGTLVDGIDVTKTKVWVNGTLVCNGGVCIAGWNVVVGGGDEPHYALTHTIPFPLSTATVVVTVYAEDIDTLNVSGSWSFTMQSDVHIGEGVGGARREGWGGGGGGGGEGWGGGGWGEGWRGWEWDGETGWGGGGGGGGGPGWGISGAWWGGGGVIVIAKDILLVNFSNRIVSDENLFDILNYEILSDTGGVVTAKVIRVLRTYFRATTSVFFHVKYLEWGNRYRFNIESNKIFDEIGKPLAAQSVVWLMQRTKVDSMISFFQRLYNNKIGDFSSMRLLVQAIAMSDEIIGGFDQENSTAP